MECVAEKKSNKHVTPHSIQAAARFVGLVNYEGSILCALTHWNFNLLTHRPLLSGEILLQFIV